MTVDADICREMLKAMGRLRGPSMASSNENEKDPASAKVPGGAAQERQKSLKEAKAARLADALRQNLQRRKAQSRSRKTVEQD